MNVILINEGICMNKFYCNIADEDQVQEHHEFAEA